MFRRRINVKKLVREHEESHANLIAQLNQLQANIDIARLAAQGVEGAESILMELDWHEAKVAHQREHLVKEHESYIRHYHRLSR
jgi:hypothetical protein